MEDYNSKGGGLVCLPTKIFLIITTLSLLIYYGKDVINGKIPNMSGISLTCCMCLISAAVMTVLCLTNPILSWGLVLLSIIGMLIFIFVQI